MFERNIYAYSVWDQEKLWKATVVVVGVGGGGGIVAELLVRIGVGHIVLVDGDKFDESNLNRQIFATQNTIGINKAEAAKKRLLSINPYINIETYSTFLSTDNNIIKLYPNAIICDCADGIENKLMVADLCAQTNNKLVTGGDGILDCFVAKFSKPSEINTHIVFKDTKDDGTIYSPNPVIVWMQASIQAYEVINSILNYNQDVDNKIQWYNLATYTNTITEE